MTLPTSGPTAQSNPDAFMGRATMNAFEPYFGLTASGYSSNAPANGVAVVRFTAPQPVYVKNMVLQNSMAAGVPAATGQASSGSQAHSYAITAFLFSRQDYGANSSNVSFVTSASFGLTATLTYTSTSQMFGMSWVTDTTGGQSTFSTSSSDAAWSNYANGPRVFSLPLVTTLTAGEYWMVFQHSSSSATSNSNVTLLSMSQLQLQGQRADNTAGFLGQSTTAGSVAGIIQNVGLLNGTPTTSTTMALTTINYAAARPVWFALSNA